MNRRTFLASLFAVPAGVALAVKARAKPSGDFDEVFARYPDLTAYRADSRGIQKLLEDCGRCVDPAPLDLDEIFNRLYAVKRRRGSVPPNLFVLNAHGQLVQIT